MMTATARALKTITILLAVSPLPVALGSTGAIVFDDAVQLQAGGAPLDLGSHAAPHLVDWDDDGDLDLLVGAADGYIWLFVNSGSTSAPVFEAGGYVEADGAPIRLGTEYTTACFVDLSGDALPDLVVAHNNSSVGYFPNYGTLAAPSFVDFLPLDDAGGGPLLPDWCGARIDVADWDGDGLNDIVAGGFDGCLSLFRNIGTSTTPSFNAPGTAFTLDGQPICWPHNIHPRVFDVNQDGVEELTYGINWGYFGILTRDGQSASTALRSHLTAFDSLGAQLNIRTLIGDDTIPDYADLNGDGTLDMISGGWNGKLFVLYSVPHATTLGRLDQIMAAHPADLGATLAGDEDLRAELFGLHRVMRAFTGDFLPPLSTRQEVADWYTAHIGTYSQYLTKQYLDPAVHPYVPVLAGQVWVNLFEALPDSPSHRLHVADTADMQGLYRSILLDFGTLFVENSSADGPQQTVVHDYLGGLPADLWDAEVITIRDFLGSGLPSEVYIDKRTGVNIFSVRVGDWTENSFPPDSPPGYVDVYSVVLAHEINHTVDAHTIAADPWLNERKYTLIEQAAPPDIIFLDHADGLGMDLEATQAHFLSQGYWDGDPGTWWDAWDAYWATGPGVGYEENWLRNNLDLMCAAPQEAFATLANQYFTNSHMMLDLAVARWNRGITPCINQFIYFVEVYSEGGGSAHSYQIDTAGNITRGVFDLHRNDDGHIDRIAIGPRAWGFELDDDGFVIALSEPPPAEGIYWNNPAGGTFSAGTNWVGGTAPGSADGAVFDLDSAYMVDFAENADTLWLSAGNGTITFDLNGNTYTLLDTAYYPLQVGDATLTLINGTLDASAMDSKIDGASGELIVSTGANAALATTIVGNAASGVLTVENGGAVQSEDAGIGVEAGSNGVVTVDGLGSTWTLDQGVSVGVYGHGELTIAGGANVQAVSQPPYVSAIAGGAGGDGQVVVTGTGSSWDVNKLYVGFGGVGLLNIVDGGAVDCPELNIGYDQSSVGVVAVIGPDSTLDCQFVNVGGLLCQGTLFAANGAVVSASAIYVRDDPGSVLTGDGTIQATVYSSGLVEPGAPTGTLTVEGYFQQYPVGTLHIELGGLGAGDYDRLAITQGALSDNLQISLTGGFDPQPGDSFEIFTATGVYTGRFDSILGADLGDGRILYVEYEENSVLVHTDTMSGLSIVPASMDLPLGFPASLAATADVAIASQADVSASAQWTSDDPNIVSVGEAGDILAESLGTTTVRAAFAGFNAEAVITVVALPAQMATDRVSVSSDEEQAEGNTGAVSLLSLSADGQTVAFTSTAANLVAGDTNQCRDVFIRDISLGETSRISVDSVEQEANDTSNDPSLSADGRHVAFVSTADNLVPGDTNGQSDIFVHDRLTGQTARVTVDGSGGEANGASYLPYISGNGRFVTFHSGADNLVPGDANGAWDVFVHDRDLDENGTFDEPGGTATVRVSVDSAGTEADGDSFSMSISSTGRYVVFLSGASNLVADDLNGAYDLFVHDRDVDSDGVFDEPGAIDTERISVHSDGTEADAHSDQGCISADGRYVAFLSDATNLVDNDSNGQRDVFVHDRQTAETWRVSTSSYGAEGNGACGSLSLSADGRFVSFRSLADNLIPHDTNEEGDIFRHDRINGATVRINLTYFGGQANGLSGYTATSADGRAVVFNSYATNLVPLDTNGWSDVFARFDLPGDIDGDRAVDIADFQAFTDCMTGPGFTYEEGCASADIGGDWDVDLRDFAELQTSFGTTAP